MRRHIDVELQRVAHLPNQIGDGKLALHLNKGQGGYGMVRAACSGAVPLVQYGGNAGPGLSRLLR
jgi:hypothetical protein